MKKIICLNGPPSSGKDTIANILTYRYGAINLKLAQPLRDVVSAVFNITDHIIDKVKNNPINIKQSNYRIRDFMIDVSELIIKPKLDENWFSNTLCNRIKSKYINEEIIAISDIGFYKELDVIYNTFKDSHDIELWKIYRTGKDFSTDSRTYFEYPIKTVLINNFYTLDVLANEVLKNIN